MSKPIKFLLVSLPTSISPANDHDEALTALRSAVTTDNGSVFPFQIPEFKIGTLDALVQQADELAKLDPGCEAVVAKVGDSLRVILEGDEDKIAQQKNVNDSQSTTWRSNHRLILGRIGGPIFEDFSLEQGQIPSGQINTRTNRHFAKGTALRCDLWSSSGGSTNNDGPRKSQASIVM